MNKKHRKNPAAVALGRLGGKKTGPSKARPLSSAQGRKMALARWAKQNSHTKPHTTT
jgi:hypothetical protein